MVHIVEQFFVLARQRTGNDSLARPDGIGEPPVRRHCRQRPGLDMRPAWSPDGKRIAFTSVRDGNYCLAAPGTAYGIYLGAGGAVDLDLRGVTGSLTVVWHNVTTGATKNGGPIAGGIGAFGFLGEFQDAADGRIAFERRFAKEHSE